MYKVKVSIKGLSPLRFNRFLPRGKDEPNLAKMTHEEQVKHALVRSYRDDKKGFYVPKEALRACILNGGAKVKIGRGGAKNLLKAILIFEDDKYFLGTNKYKIQQDVVRIPPGPGGARVTQYWVVIEKWKLDFECVILDDIFPVDGLKDSISVAGMYFGLLDGRPQLGRFELVKFDKVKEK